MLEKLKKTIELKKQKQSNCEEPKRVKIHENSYRGSIEEEEELEKASKALKEKAQKYHALESGEINVIPKGSLVDFEKKLDRFITKEEELDEEEEDDAQSRSLATIAPPVFFQAISRKDRIVKEAVDTLLSDVLEETKKEERT